MKGNTEQQEKPADIHVLPTFGREHVETANCWCGPRLEQYEALLVIHNLEN